MAQDKENCRDLMNKVIQFWIQGNLNYPRSYSFSKLLKILKLAYKLVLL